MIATDLDDDPEPGGETLRERLRACHREGKTGLPVPELLRHIAAVADALDDRGRPHSDVRPETIRVVNGQARLTGPAAGAGPASSPTVVAGAPAYMAPEVWACEAGRRSDQYALACTYAELRTGRPPFCGPDLLTVMRAHLEVAPDLEGCTDTERRVLTQALAKGPDQRFPTCRELAEHLARAIAAGPSETA